MENIMTWVYTVSIPTVIFIVIYLGSQSRRIKQHHPPAPRSLPVIGHLHLLKLPLQRTLQSLSAQYGPVYGLKLGKRYSIVISSPAAVEECFGKNDVVLADRPQFLASKHLLYDSTTMGASNYGDHWRHVRRISNQEVFSVSRQTMFLSLRQEEVKCMIMSLFCSTRCGQGIKHKVEMKSKFGDLTFSIIVRIVTGKRYNYCDQKVENSAEARGFQEIIRELFDQSATSNPGDFLPFIGLFDIGGYEKRMLQLKERIDKVLQNLIDECKQAMDGSRVMHPQSLLSYMLTMQKTDPTSFSDKIIKGLLLMLIAAGTETVAVTIEWAMSLLLNNPEKLKKAQSELDATISPVRLVDESDLPNLTYLHAIINETLRMYPDAPLLGPHYSSSECTIQGFHVPRGTMILANAWAIHRDPKLWEDPLSFKPERWFENMDESHAYKYIPFGLGRRSCPGANMAHKVVGLTLASLIQCFDWERVGEEEIDMTESHGLTMHKLEPLEARCRPRDCMMNVLSQVYEKSN